MPAAPESAAVERYVSKYLSEGHVTHPGRGCPIAALAVDAGRIGGGVAETTASSIKRLLNAIALHLPGGKKTARERASVTLATLVGAVVIARASGNSDVGKEILAACRKHLDA